jgi:hypothetical protein
MGAKGTFDLPMRKDQSTKGARRAYQAAYGEAWPGTDDDLRRFAGSASCCRYLIHLMRRTVDEEATLCPTKSS